MNIKIKKDGLKGYTVSVTLPERLFAKDEVICVYKEQVLEEIRKTHPSMTLVGGPQKITNKNRHYLVATYRARTQRLKVESVPFPTPPSPQTVATQPKTPKRPPKRTRVRKKI